MACFIAGSFTYRTCMAYNETQIKYFTGFFQQFRYFPTKPNKNSKSKIIIINLNKKINDRTITNDNQFGFKANHNNASLQGN